MPTLTARSYRVLTFLALWIAGFRSCRAWLMPRVQLGGERGFRIVRRDRLGDDAGSAPDFASDNLSSTDKDSNPNISSSSSSSSRSDENFLNRCQQLCRERNLPLEKVKNARDLASVHRSPIRPGRILRMGRVSDASQHDIQLLFQELNITTLIDTRSPTELKEDATLLREEVFDDFTNIVWSERARKARELDMGEGPVRKRFFQRFKREPKNKEELVSTTIDQDMMPLVEDVVATEDHNSPESNQASKSTDTNQPVYHDHINYRGDRKERHFVSLMNEFKYVKGTVTRVRKRDLAKGLLKAPGAAFSKRIRNSIQRPFIDEINGGGLPMLNELLLRFGAPGIRYVLELCMDPHRQPIAFYCTAGKDRTGMIAAIILKLCGAKDEDIVEDYMLSANVYAEMNDHKAMVGALSQRNLDAKTFLGAPPQVMRDTLAAIDEDYGSVEGYCNWIGFGPEKQERLRQALMQEKSSS